MTESTSSTTPLICCFFDAAFGDDYERECRKEIDLLDRIFLSGQLIELVFLEHASPETLEKFLMERGTDMVIFHYVGTEATFQTLIKKWDYPSQTPNLRLFFYSYDNSCDEAERLTKEQGVPLAIGFNTTLDLPYALGFIDQFYKALLSRFPVRDAFAEALSRVGPAPKKRKSRARPKHGSSAELYDEEHERKERKLDR